MQWVAVPGQMPAWEARAGSEEAVLAAAVAAAAAAVAAPPPPTDDLLGNLTDLRACLELARACHAARAAMPAQNPGQGPGPNPGQPFGPGPGGAPHGAYTGGALRGGPGPEGHNGGHNRGSAQGGGRGGGMVYMQPLPDRSLGYHTHLPTAAAVAGRARAPPRSSSADNLERRAVRPPMPSLPNGMHFHAPAPAQAPAAVAPLAVPQPRPTAPNGPLANGTPPLAPAPAQEAPAEARAPAGAGRGADAAVPEARPSDAIGLPAAAHGDWPPLGPTTGPRLGALQSSAGEMRRRSGDAGSRAGSGDAGPGPGMAHAEAEDWPRVRPGERSSGEWAAHGDGGAARVASGVAPGAPGAHASSELGRAIVAGASEHRDAWAEAPPAGFVGLGSGSGTATTSPSTTPPQSVAAPPEPGPAHTGPSGRAGAITGAPGAAGRGRGRADAGRAPAVELAVSGGSPRAGPRRADPDARAPDPGVRAPEAPRGGQPDAATPNFSLADEDFPALGAGQRGRRGRGDGSARGGSSDPSPSAEDPVGECPGLAPVAVPRSSWALGDSPGDSPPPGRAQVTAVAPSAWPGTPLEAWGGVAAAGRRASAASASAPATPLAGTSPMRPPPLQQPASARSPPAPGMSGGRGRGPQNPGVSPGSAAAPQRVGERAWSPVSGGAPAWGAAHGAPAAAAAAAAGRGDLGQGREGATRVAWGGRGLPGARAARAPGRGA